jgi:hypothetical protein
MRAVHERCADCIPHSGGQRTGTAKVLFVQHVGSTYCVTSRGAWRDRSGGICAVARFSRAFAGIRRTSSVHGSIGRPEDDFESQYAASTQSRPAAFARYMA